MKIRFTSPAQRDLTSSISFYLNESAQAAINFESEFETAVHEIAESPTLYPVYSGTIRRKVLEKFPYTIFYRMVAGEVVILAIVHQARRPDFWRKRDA